MGDIQSIDAWRSRVVEASEKILAQVAPPQDPAPEVRSITDGAALAAAAPWAFSTRRVDRSAVTGLDKS